MRTLIDADYFDANITVYSYPLRKDLIEMGEKCEQRVSSDDRYKQWKFEIRSDVYGWACRLIVEKGNYGEGHWVCGGKANTRMPTMLAKSIKTIDALWMERDE